MSIIAQMSPAQYAQMREQMLGEQMLEQLNQLSPPPLHPPQQQQPPTIHDNQLHGTVVCSVGSWALYLDSEM